MNKLIVSLDMDYKKLAWISVGVMVAFWLGPVAGPVAAVVAGSYYGGKLAAGLLSEGLGFILRKLGVSKRDIGKIQIRMKERKRQRMEKNNAKTRFFDPEFSMWKLEQFPAGIALEEPNSDITAVQVNGVRRFMANSNDGMKPASFYTVLGDEDFVKVRNAFTHDKDLASRYSLKTVGKNGYPQLSSDDPKAMLYMVNFLHPQVECRVQRTVESVNQYRIEGCKSTEEAIEKLKALKGHGAIRPLNSFIRVSDVVNGKGLNDSISGSPIVPEKIEPGVYLINESMTTKGAGTVTVDSLSDKDETYDAAAVRFDLNAPTSTVERRDEEPSYSNAKGDRNLPQYMKRNGEDNCKRVCGETIGNEVVNGSIILRFSSEKELADAMAHPEKFVGHMVLFDDDIPAAGKGEYVLTIPGNAETLKSLEIVDGSDKKLLSDYACSGLTPEEANLSALLHEYRSDGYVSARLTSKFDLSNAMINGVPKEDFDTLTNQDRIKTRSAAEREQWLQDAALVRSVDMKIDIKKRELVVSSSITTPTSVENRTERRRLTDEQIYDLSGRDISNAEMKDLLMKMYPDRFNTYKDKSVAADLLSAFIDSKASYKTIQAKGRVKDVSKEQEKERVSAPVRKRSSGVRIS